MRAISAGVGLAGSGKDTGFCMKFRKAECNFVTSRPHPTLSKAWAHCLLAKNSRGAWPSCHRNSSCCGSPPWAVRRSCWFFLFIQCLNALKALVSSGCSRPVLEAGTKRSWKPFLLAKDINLLGRWGDAVSKTSIGLTIGSQGWTPLSHLPKFGSCNLLSPKEIFCEEAATSSVAALQNLWRQSGEASSRCKPGSAAAPLECPDDCKARPRMCRRSSADFWGPAFVDPLARGKTSSHSPRNLSDMVDSKEQKFHRSWSKPVPGGQISRSHRQWISRTPSPGKTKIRVSKKWQTRL